jgi:hypothetical protein
MRGQRRASGGGTRKGAGCEGGGSTGQQEVAALKKERLRDVRDRDVRWF